MSKKKDKITENDLMIFSKKELIQVIFKAGWIFNPITMLYRNRSDTNHDMIGRILKENGDLVNQFQEGMDIDLYIKVSESLEKNRRKIDRLHTENEKIEKILYGDISMDD
jgi:hypothetical protein